ERASFSKAASTCPGSGRRRGRRRRLRLEPLLAVARAASVAAGLPAAAAPSTHVIAVPVTIVAPFRAALAGAALAAPLRAAVVAIAMMLAPVIVVTPGVTLAPGALRAHAVPIRTARAHAVLAHSGPPLARLRFHARTAHALPRAE